LLAAVFCLTAIGLLISPASIYQQARVAAAPPEGKPAGKPSGKPTPIPTPNVTSTIFDKSIDDLTFMDLRSDGLNPNLTTTGGPFGIYGTSSTNNVADRFEGFENSDWSLHLEDSATRWIGLTLNRLTGSGPSGSYNLHARVISRCFDPSGTTTNTVGWLTIATSDPNCSMHINFTLAGTSYALIMSPYDANTGRATVSCNASSSGQCSDWTIVPNMIQDSIVNPNPTVANLFSNGKGGKQTLVGAYSLTYRIHLTRS